MRPDVIAGVLGTAESDPPTLGAFRPPGQLGMTPDTPGGETLHDRMQPRRRVITVSPRALNTVSVPPGAVHARNRDLVSNPGHGRASRSYAAASRSAHRASR